jgi:dipeptidyl aminopeptidase/acylaminoacyl peptidase
MIKVSLKIFFSAVFLFTVLSLPQKGFSQESRLIPLKDFFRNPQSSNYQISPDGNYISFTKSYKNRLNIFVQSRDSNVTKRVTSVTDRDIVNYTWKGNDHIVYMKDFGGDENYHLFAVDRDGKSYKDLTPFPGVKAEIIDDLPDSDTEMIVGLNKRTREFFDAYMLDVATGKLNLITENPGNITEWITDHKGKIRAAITTDGVNNSLLYRETQDMPFKTVITVNFRDTVQPLFFTFDNRSLYCLSNRNRDKIAAVILSPEDGHETEVIFEHPQVDVDGLAYSRKRKVLTEIYYTTWKTERKILDREIQDIFGFLDSRLPDTEIFLVSHNRQEDIFIVRVTSDRSPGAYYLYEKNGNMLVKLAEVMPWLKKEDLAQVKPIEYESRDGLTIHGYLTLSGRKVAKNLPVVINPHGGPWARDVWSYDPEIQFLANRGYAVLQMNFRGSTSYGKKFWEDSFKQWGLKMQGDITDGVNWLIARGIADPKRIAIYGGSYGGYAVLAGLVFTPDLYVCGIDYCGVSNLFTLLKSIPPYWKPVLDQWYEMVGNPKTDKALFERISPVFHADKIKVPLLVAQGARDPRVNIDESNQIVAALRKRGIPVTYIVKQNEGHGFLNQENRFDFYRAMERFLSKYLEGS